MFKKVATKTKSKASSLQANSSNDQVFETTMPDHKEGCYTNIGYISFVCILGVIFLCVYIIYQNWLTSELISKMATNGVTIEASQSSQAGSGTSDEIKKQIETLNTAVTQAIDKSTQASHIIEDSTKRIVDYYHIAMIGQIISQKLAVGSSYQEELDQLKKFDTSKVASEVNTLGEFSANRLTPSAIQSQIIKLMTTENVTKEEEKKDIWESFKSYFSSLLKIQKKNTTTLSTKELHEYLALSLELMNQGEIRAAYVLISTRLHNNADLEQVEDMLKRYLAAYDAAQTIVRKNLSND